MEMLTITRLLVTVNFIMIRLNKQMEKRKRKTMEERDAWKMKGIQKDERTITMIHSFVRSIVPYYDRKAN